MEKQPDNITIQKLKKKNALYLFFIVFLIGIFQYFTWGIVVEIGTEFNLVRKCNNGCNVEDPPPEKRIFIPDHYYFSCGRGGIPIFLVLNSISWNALPCDIIFSKNDPTYLQRHEFYQSFTFDSLSISYKDGTQKNLLSVDMPISQRAFSICENCESIKFKNAITKNQDFSLKLKGTTLKKNGEMEFFDVEEKYTSDNVFRVYPLAGSF